MREPSADGPVASLPLVEAVDRLGTADEVFALDAANGTLLAVAAERILLWRQDEVGWIALEAPEGGARRAAALSPDGAGVYVSDGHLVQTAPIRKHLRALKTFVDAGGPVESLRWSPRGDVLLIGTASDRFAVDWSGRTLWSGPPGGPVAWHPTGERLAVGAGTSVRWIEAATGVELERAELEAEPVALACGPRGSLAVAHPGGRVVLQGVALGPLPALVRALAFSPGSGRLAACGGGRCVVWAPTGEQLGDVDAPQGALDHLVWLDDDRIAVAGRGPGPAVAVRALRLSDQDGQTARLRRTRA